jgi:hypothetical protein
MFSPSDPNNKSLDNKEQSMCRRYREEEHLGSQKHVRKSEQCNKSKDES